MKKNIKYALAAGLITAGMIMMKLYVSKSDQQHFALVGFFILMIGTALLVVTAVVGDYVKPKKDEMPKMFWNYDGSEVDIGKTVTVRLQPNFHNDLPAKVTVNGIEYLHPDEHKRRMEDAFNMARDKIKLPPDFEERAYRLLCFEQYWEYHQRALKNIYGK